MTPQNKKEKIKSLLARAEALKPSNPLKFSLNLDGDNTIADKEKDLKPLVEIIGKMKKLFDSKYQSIVTDMTKSFEGVNSLISSTEENINNSNKTEFKDIADKLQSLKKEFSSKSDLTIVDLKATKDVSTSEINGLRSNIKSVEGEISKILSLIGDDSKDKETNKKSVTQELSTLKISVETLKDETESKLNKAAKEFIERLSSIQSKMGGGSMNRQIKVGGTDVLKTYTDINLIGGSGVTITTANDNTDKNVDITFSSAGAVNSFIGLVDGSNNEFVFATAPNALSVDNVPKQRVSSDGTVNWTISGTTVTLLVAPNYDLFALN